MRQITEKVQKATTLRSQHLVFLLHVWLLAPFMLLWARPESASTASGDVDIANLRPVVFILVGYLGGRTYLAFKDPKWLNWQYVFPLVDTAIIATILWISHRGPLSNVTLLLILPIVQAAGSLNVRWAALVGFIAVVAMGFSTLQGGPQPIGIREGLHQGTLELLKSDPLNVGFRLYFFVILASLLTYQALIGAEATAALQVQRDRSRLALEIHDGVQGSLIALAAQLELIRLLADRDPQRTGEIADEARQAARQAADDLRFLVQRMRAPVFGSGFIPAMRQYVANLRDRYGWNLELTTEGDERILPTEVEQAAFRILQEALTNVAKHAQATAVQIRAHFSPECLVLEIQDNGVGFHPVMMGTSVGLEGMKERAELRDGTLEVISEPGQGTTIRATLSIQVEPPPATPMLRLRPLLRLIRRPRTRKSVS